MSSPWQFGGRIGRPSQEGPLSLGPAQGHEQEAREGGWVQQPLGFDQRVGLRVEKWNSFAGLINIEMHSFTEPEISFSLILYSWPVCFCIKYHPWFLLWRPKGVPKGVYQFPKGRASWKLSIPSSIFPSLATSSSTTLVQIPLFLSWIIATPFLLVGYCVGKIATTQNPIYLYIQHYDQRALLKIKSDHTLSALCTLKYPNSLWEKKNTTYDSL